MQFDDDEVYFQCPNCPATYNFTEFHKLEHKSQASPSEGSAILGHATCRHCSKDFYYYLTSDVIPIVVNNDPLRDIPDEILSGGSYEEAIHEPLDEQAVPVVIPEPGGKDQTGHKGNQEDKMAQFKETLNGIDGELPPPELAKKMSETLDIIVTETPSQVEAGLALLKKKFNLNARNIEAFRKEINRKRNLIKKDDQTKEANAEFAKLSQPPKELTEEEKKNALAYLQDSNLFQNISRDIAVAGEVVGEETNKMMLYLAATSRKFKDPISLVIFGKSSAGKTHVAKAVLKFMPQEDILILSYVSAKALEYSGDQLKHKCMLVEEWEGLAEILPTLRVLLSEGKLSRYVPAIDPETKKLKSVATEQECPCSVIVTTTKEGIHNENSTRIFVLQADERLRT